MQMPGAYFKGDNGTDLKIWAAVSKQLIYTWKFGKHYLQCYLLR